jgi:hypothetical protein
MERASSRCRVRGGCDSELVCSSRQSMDAAAAELGPSKLHVTCAKLRSDRFSLRIIFIRSMLFPLLPLPPCLFVTLTYLERCVGSWSGLRRLRWQMSSPRFPD